MFNWFKRKEMNANICAPVGGQLLKMEDVPDPVFADKVMGDGFAVKPNSGRIYSPICGTIESIFPTKHAIVIKHPAGHSVIVHMGIDTVELGGKPFKLHVSEGQLITQDSRLVDIDLAYLAASGKDDTIIVAFPEAASPFQLKKAAGQVEARDVLSSFG